MKFIICLIITVVFATEPEESLDAAESIEYNLYPAEKHYVQTPDGYINQIQRIPFGRDNRPIQGCNSKRPIMFLQHGLFASSYEFLMNLPSQSPAYVFADAGFDVWLGNVRGTEYGRNHTTLKTNDRRFWNFTFYDHAHSDLVSQIEYVLEKTGQESLFYVGHSQGTTVMFARLAEAEPAWQKKIRAFFGLGPSAGSVKATASFLLLEIEDIQRLIQFVLDGKFGIIPITIPHPLIDRLAEACGNAEINHICSAALDIGGGREKLSQLNDTRLPVILKHFPSTTSTLNLLHWVQTFKYHELRHLDLGPERNLEAYGQKEAPRLNISNIEAPTYLFFSHDDIITDDVDVREIILKHMGPGLRNYTNLDHFTHIDFAVGLRANDEVYRPIIQTIREDIQKNGC
ncbi:unnamed protein product [Caenorhabditis angaria]|uniref:Lipase n=1 Tax=Caenorhabditis angaria TaxID=860376 RepID=A0A9P1IW58_9PELO|nr:unnamed protein product [Caenorhabditis angaria]